MIQGLLGVSIIGSFVGILILWTFYPPQGTDPAQIAAMFNIMIGILAGGAGTVIGWYFGSSKDSSGKNDTITSLAKSVEQTPPAPPAQPGAQQ